MKLTFDYGFMNRSCLQYALAFSFFGTGALTLVAQDEGLGSEVYELSPFEVDASQSEGYLDTQSLAGSRFAQDLKDISAPVEIINQEVFDDLGVYDLQEVMDYSVNAVASGVGDSETVPASGLVDGERRSSNIRVRGGILLSLSRDYFRWSLNSDRFNIERVDNSRGPNAILFGDSSLAGLSNVSTKRAKFNRIYEVSVNLDSYGGGRVSIDFNQPIIDEKFALRLNAFKQDTDQWRDFGNENHEAIALAATLRPVEGMEIRLQGEAGTNDDLFVKSAIRARVSDWDGITVMETPDSLSGAQRTAAGIAREGNNTQTIMGARPEDGINNWVASGRTNGADNFVYTSLLNSEFQPALIDQAAELTGTQSDLILPDLDYGARPLSNRVEQEYRTASIIIEKRITDDFFVELGANIQESERSWNVGSANIVYYDVSRSLPAGYTIDGSSENPDFLKPFVRGRPNIRTFDFESTEFRALAIYKLRTDWFNQTIGASISYREFSGIQQRKSLSVTNGTNEDLSATANLPFVRYNLSDSAEDQLYFEDGKTYDIGGSILEFVNTSAVAAGQSNSETEMLSMTAFVSGSWFSNRRLHTTAGIRRDTYDSKNFNDNIFDSTTGVFIRSDLQSELSDTIDSPSFGAVFQLFDWVSVYANISKAFVFGDIRQVDYQGDVVAPPIGQSKDIGLKFYAGRKLSATVGYYDSRQENNTIINNRINNQFNNVINPTLGRDDFGNPVDSGTLTARGWEAQFVWSPTRSFSIRGNMALPESTTERPFESFLSFYDPIAAELRAEADALIASSNDTTVSDALDVVDEERALIMAGLDTENNSYDVLGSVLARYKFVKGPLKGVSVGGGLKYRGERQIAIIDEVEFSSDPYIENTAFVSYIFNHSEVRYRLQLNVSNVFDSENFVARTLDATTTDVRAYRVSSPRNIRLSLTASF